MKNKINYAGDFRKYVDVSFLQASQTQNILAVNEQESRLQRMLREINRFKIVSGLKLMTSNESYAKFAQKVAESNAKNRKLQHFDRAKNRRNAGVEGKRLRMETIEIRMVKKSDRPPVSGNSFSRKNGHLLPR